MQNEMNMKNKMHKCVPRNSQINLLAQEFERCKIAGRPLNKRTFGFYACKMLAEKDGEFKSYKIF